MMINNKRRIGLFLVGFFILSIFQSTVAQVSFHQFFTEGCIRLDLVLAGNHEISKVYLDEIRKEPHWGGSHSNMIDPFGYGEYRILVQDDSTGELIYSKGFCTFFEEWQTVAEAKERDRAFDQVVRFPVPRSPVSVEIQERDESNIFQTKYKVKIDPADPYIIEGLRTPCAHSRIVYNGEASDHVDLVFVAEGYTAGEIGKFYSDAERLSTYMLDAEPFNKYREKFNIYAVASVSDETGTDLPGDGIWKNTALNSNFYTFKLERYLTTEDCKAVNDAAANVPCDQVCILVNTEKYGGGGIYNHYSIVSSDDRLSEIVFVHEFGHVFAGLGDEYYTSNVSYEEFYKLDLEPWQPNLTTLVDFDSKWKGMIDKDTPVPTPAEEKYSGITGVFEGGGYSARGIYRPAMDCRMKSNVADHFCEVCQDAIIRMIEYYSE